MVIFDWLAGHWPFVVMWVILLLRQRRILLQHEEHSKKQTARYKMLAEALGIDIKETEQADSKLEYL